jgi:hypothetical protein
MFPPEKKKPAGPGGPQSGAPPDPFAPPAGPGGPGVDPTAGGVPDPFAPPAGPQPGAAQPGQGIDPMVAMLQGLGPEAFGQGSSGPQGPPVGPDGLPVGGSLPPLGDDGGLQDPSLGGSDLLQALQGSLSGGDPYGVTPEQPGQGFQGIGTGDPSLGIEQLLQMLALGKQGVGGGPDSGLDPSQSSTGGAVGY